MAKQQEKATWSLNSSALDRFLERLDADQVRAAELYEEIRTRTIRYLESRGIGDADVWADRVMDRAARRMEAIGVIEEPRSFVAGVARKVAREARRCSKRAQDALNRLRHEPVQEPGSASSIEQEDPRLAVLHRCLNSFSPQDKALITTYYQGRLRGKIDERKGLCQSLGLEAGTLRVRAHRLRLRLEMALHAEMSRCEIYV